MTAEPPAARDRLPDEDKTGLRARMRTARIELGPATRAQASAEACALLTGMPELRGAGPFLLYAALGDELNLDALAAQLLRRGAVLCLPRVDGPDLVACRIHDLAGLRPGWRGVREPAPDAAEIAVGELRTVVTPGLAFDLAGNRLGYGGGHFDRLLARLPPETTVIGAAFDVQIVSELPSAAHDRPVHTIVTESRVIRTR